MYLWRFTVISPGDLAAKGGRVGWEGRSGGVEVGGGGRLNECKKIMKERNLNTDI